MVQENWEDNKIYVNDYLTTFNRNLFFKTKAFAREAGFKYVWFKDSKLFVNKMMIIYLFLSKMNPLLRF